MRRLSLVIFLSLTASPLFAQEFLEQMHKGMNFFEIQKRWKAKHPSAEVAKKAPTTALGVDADEREGGEDAFEEVEGDELLYARWEDFWKHRVLPNGEFPSANFLWDQWQKQRTIERELKAKQGNKVLSPQAWTFLGPTTKVPTGKFAGSGRVACARFDPNSPDILWAGTPGGGLWRYEITGTTGQWFTSTDTLPSLGVTDIAINPSNPEQVFIATGDVDGGNSYTYGLLRSDDLGHTWKRTSLNYQLAATQQISRVVFMPNNPNILLCAASSALFRSTNNGETWKSVLGAQVRDIEFRPDNPNVIYASAGGSVYRSTDGGASFLKLGVSWSGMSRVALGVTPADPKYVYALLSNSRSGFGGLYRSTNGGDAWTKMSDGTQINILNWDVSGAYNASSSQQGQGTYDLAIAVSPDDPDMIFCGGVNIWRSTNGGTDWQISAHWQGDNGTPAVHADVHDLVFQPTSSTLYACTDGGVFYSPDFGATWTDISAGLGILQFYRIGTNPNNPKMVVGGCQDNGTNRYARGDWKYVKFADGMEAFYDKGGQYAYTTIYYGRLFRSQDSGSSFPREITANGSNTGPWITPFILQPHNQEIIFCGANAGIFRSDNRGDSWYTYSKSPVGSTVALSMSASDTSRFYAASDSKVYTTADAGKTWQSITNNLKTSSISAIVADPNRAEVVALTVSNFDSTSKVYLTTNAGASWTNITRKGLPTAPVNCAAWYKTSCLNMLIVGTDLGVYFTTEEADSWQSLNTGLPNAIIRDLDVTQNLLHVGTFGRGLWELVLPQTSPKAEIKIAEQGAVCPGTPVHFSNQSAGGNGDILWTFEGGTPSSSQLTNPVVRYASGGNYSVKLRVTNECSSDSVTLNAAVRVYNVDKARTFVDERKHNLTAQVEGSYQWFKGSTAITGATAAVFHYDSTGTYILRVIDQNGCTSYDTTVITTVGINTLSVHDELQMYPVPAQSDLHLQWDIASPGTLDLVIFDVRSNEVFRSAENASAGAWQKVLSVRDLPAGEYILQLSSNGRTLRRSFVKAN